MASISKIREAVESLLSEVTVKPPNRTQDSDQLNISIENLDGRLTALEALSHSFVKVNDGREISSLRSEPKGPGDDVTCCLSLPPLLEEMLEKKISGLQSELEDAVRSGWADVVNRNSRVAEEDVNLGEVVQRLQGVVSNIEIDQQSISESVVILKQKFQNIESAPKAEVPDIDGRINTLVPVNVPTMISRIPMKPSLSDSVLFASPLKARPVRSNRYPDPESPQSLLASPGEYVDVHSRGWPVQFPSLSAASVANTRREEDLKAAMISSKDMPIDRRGVVEEEDTVKTEENVRMSIRMLASLTDCVYMNTGTDIPYQPLMAVDISTFSVVKHSSSMSSGEVEGVASTSSEIGRSSARSSGNRSEDSYLRERSPHRDYDIDSSSVHERDHVDDDSKSHLLISASHDIDKDDFEALRRSVSLHEYIDPDELQRLHLKKSQHRSQFLKMVMIKK